MWKMQRSSFHHPLLDYSQSITEKIVISKANQRLEGYLTKFNRSVEAPPQGLTPYSYIPFWQKIRWPFYIPFIEKRHPFHIPTLEHCTPFLSPCNEVNEQYYGRISLPEEMLSKRQVLFILFTLLVGVKILRTSGARTTMLLFAIFIKPFQCLLYLYMYILFNEC